MLNANTCAVSEPWSKYILVSYLFSFLRLFDTKVEKIIYIKYSYTIVDDT